MPPSAPHDTADLRRINMLLEQGLALPEGECEAWLQALPQEHRALMPVLRALLLRAEVETDTFMRKPVGLGADAWVRRRRRG
jgi:eukaryotic-like serine/threonine-protein kinase